MITTNTSVGGISTLTVYKGGFLTMNEVWHKTNTSGVRWFYQPQWNNPGAVHWRNVQISKVSKIRGVSSGLTKAGGVLVVADVFLSGELKPSHSVNGVLLAASTTGVGAIVAGAYFIFDMGWGAVNYIGNGEFSTFGDYLDGSVGAFELYDGVY